MKPDRDDSKQPLNHQPQNPSSYVPVTRRGRCGQCEGCKAKDCGTCKFCKDKRTYGGPGRLKKSCVARQCQGKLQPSINVPTTPIVSSGQDKRNQLKPQKQEQPTNSLGKAPASQSNRTNKQSDIASLLLEQNRKIRPIVGDGNCFFRALSFYRFGNQEQHLQVRTEIVKFISENHHLFEALVISDDNSYTLIDHLGSMKNPMVWATQVEIQAAADLYATPIYLFTPNPTGSGYQWYHYNKRTPATPQVQHHHFELAHCSGNHFDCIVDAATMRPSTVPPKLAGEQAHHPQVL